MTPTEPTADAVDNRSTRQAAPDGWTHGVWLAYLDARLNALVGFVLGTSVLVLGHLILYGETEVVETGPENVIALQSIPGPATIVVAGALLVISFRLLQVGILNLVEQAVIRDLHDHPNINEEYAS